MTRSNVVFAFDTIEMAFDYANFDDHSNEAYLDRHTGNVLYFSTFGDSDDEPEDFDDESRYVVVPDTRDFGLGSKLAFDFIAEVSPALLDDVHNAFDGRGGFRRFKDLLDRHDLLEAWYSYEAQCERSAILKWCDDNDIRYTNPVNNSG